jgi:hypothetical protein
MMQEYNTGEARKLSDEVRDYVRSVRIHSGKKVSPSD